MSIEELEEQKEGLLTQIEGLEEKCDTLEICQEDKGCDKCESYQKIEDLSAKVGEIENKIEELMGDGEEEEED